MSSVLVYRFGDDQKLDLSREGIKNAYRGCLSVWNIITEKFTNLGSFPHFDEQKMSEFWKIAHDRRLPEFARITLMSTYDRVVVKAQDIPRLIKALEEFDATYNTKDTLNLKEQVAAIRRLACKEGTTAICWEQNSMNEGSWLVVSTHEKQLPKLSLEELQNLERRLAQRSYTQSASVTNTLIYDDSPESTPYVEHRRTRSYNLKRDDKHFDLFEQLAIEKTCAFYRAN